MALAVAGKQHVLALAMMVAALLLPAPALAAGAMPRAFIPNLFDPAHQTLKPEPVPVKELHFLTTDDFPPFHFALPDGTLAGFDIDLAKAICADLKLPCTIQARRFETLDGALKSGQGNVLIAALANTPSSRAGLAFTAPYYTTPARFVTRLISPIAGVTPQALAGHTIGVQDGTAHLAYLQAFYAGAGIKIFPDQDSLRASLRNGQTDVIFGDGIALSLWLNGTDSANCCAFQGGPFTESHFFGNGVSLAVAKDAIALRALLDYELEKVSRDGIYTDLYLKYFPAGFY